MKRLIFVFLALFLVHAQTAQANDLILVTSRTDDSDANPGDGTCATAAGECGLRAAIEEANAFAGSDELFLIGAPTFFIGSQLNVTDALTIRGAGTSISRIDGNDAVRIFSVTSTRLILEDLKLRNGNAGVSNGGAILTNNSSNNQLTLHNVVIESSSANNGGAVYALAPIMYVRDSLIENNQATFDGGGIVNNQSGSLTIVERTIIRNNGSGDDGAGISLVRASMRDVAIYDNVAQGNGGGVRLLTGNSTLTQVTVSGNTANDGGGVYHAGTDDLQLNNVTITDNFTNNDGGGVYSNGTVITRNSIVADNRDLAGANSPDCHGSDFVSEGYNLFGLINALCTFSGDTANDFFGTTTPLDPQLGILQFNDHDDDEEPDPRPTHELQSNSPAVNSGNPDGCRIQGSPVINLIQEDQREAERHQQGRCDMGAAESAFGTPTAVELSEQSAVNSGQPLGVLFITVLLFTVYSSLPHDRKKVVVEQRNIERKQTCVAPPARDD